VARVPGALLKVPTTRPLQQLRDRALVPIHPNAWKGNSANFAIAEFADVRMAPRSYTEERSYLRGGELATTVCKKQIISSEWRPPYSSVAWPIGPGRYAACARIG
jgi:hypothetical protein